MSASKLPTRWYTIICYNPNPYDPLGTTLLHCPSGAPGQYVAFDGLTTYAEANRLYDDYRKVCRGIIMSSGKSLESEAIKADGEWKV